MTSLVPHGVSRRSYAKRVSRATTPTTPAQRAQAQRAAQAILARRRQRFAKTCGKGHRWTPANTYHAIRKSGKQAGQRVRTCKACLQIRVGRRRWLRRVRATTIARLRQQMIAAHPDKGGTVRQFVKARTAYLKAKAAA